MSVLKCLGTALQRHCLTELVRGELTFVRGKCHLQFQFQVASSPCYMVIAKFLSAVLPED